MTKLTVTAAFLATLFAACSSSDPPACKSSDSFICSDDLGAFPFVRAALAVSDLCVGSPEGNPIGDTMSCTGAIIPDGETTVTLTQPEAGRLCLAGRVSTSGFALISLSLSEASADQRTIITPFDAQSRGIAQVAMTIDTPPNQGLAVDAHMILHRECPAGGLDCFYPPNFVSRTITAAGPVVVPLSEFTSEDDPTQLLDTSVLHDVFLQFSAGPFNFCVHDFNFLDAAGNPVTP